MTFENQVLNELKVRLKDYYVEAVDTDMGSLRIIHEVAGNKEATIVMDITLNPCGNENDTYPYLIQLFTTIAGNLQMEDMVVTAAKLGELSRFLTYGSLGVYMEFSQLYHKYTFAVTRDMGYITDMTKFYVSVIEKMLDDLYGVLLVLASDPYSVDLDLIVGNE